MIVVVTGFARPVTVEGVGQIRSEKPQVFTAIIVVAVVEHRALILAEQAAGELTGEVVVQLRVNGGAE